MIKNYTSNSKNTFDVIQKCLAMHGAKAIMFNFNAQGEVDALSFSMEIDGRLIGFKLPARIDQVEIVLEGTRRKHGGTAHEQAYRTGWANIRDWVTAQMALVDTKMAKVHEVFLPYMTRKDGTTFFETLEQSKFMLPGDRGSS